MKRNGPLQRLSVPLIAALLLFPVASSHAQEEDGGAIPPDATLIDGIAAVVGHDVILLSEIEEQMVFLESQMSEAQRDTLNRDLARRSILESLVNDRLLVAEAEQAGIEVTTGEITEGVENRLNLIRGNFPDEETFKAELAAAGLDMAQLRQSYRDIVRRQILAQRVIEREVYGKVKVSDEEVRAFYDEHRDEIPDLPERVVLDHILTVPHVSESSADSVLSIMKTIRGELERGADFTELARRYSDAPGAERGGLMGTFRRGDLDPAFAAAESAAFALEPGEVSTPIRTELGLHLIRVMERNGDRVRAQQILLRLSPSAVDSAAAEARVREALKRARAGEDFGSLAREYSDDPMTRDSGGRLGTFEWAGLTENYARALRGLSDGEITEPILTPQGYQIVRLVSHDQGRPPTFEEVSGQLRELLAEDKARERYAEWIDELREKIYIRVIRVSPGGG